MKGITPVIATVILLLMAISAASLSYLTITGYQEQVGQGASASNDEMLKRMQTQVRVESVSNGRLIIRNVGSRALDNETFTALLDNVPVTLLARPECNGLEPGKTCIADIATKQSAEDASILLVTTPSGNEINVTKKDRCTMVSLDVGSAGERTTANAHCTDGTDVIGCDNDGICEMDSNENGINCPEDCGILIQVGAFTQGTGNSDIYSMVHNRTEWNIGYNITESAGVSEQFASGAYRSDADFMVIWSSNGYNYGQGEYSVRDSSTGTWSAPADLDGMTTMSNSDLLGLPDGRILLAAQDRSMTGNKDMIRARFWNGTDWGSVYNVSLESEMQSGHVFKIPELGYAQGVPIAVYMSGATCFVQSAVWNGTEWTDHHNITTGCDVQGHVGATSDPNGNVRAVWNEISGFGYQVVSATWDGAQWTDYLNVTAVGPDPLMDAAIGIDPYGYAIAIYRNSTDDQTYTVLKTPSSAWGVPVRVSDDAVIGSFMLENVGGSVTIFWVENTGAEFIVKTRAWNGVTKTLDPVQTIMECTTTLTSCVDVYS